MDADSAISRDVLARYAADAEYLARMANVTPASVDVVFDTVSAPPPKR